MKYLQSRTAIWVSFFILIAAIALSSIYLKDIFDARQELEESRPKPQGPMREDERKRYNEIMKSIDRQVKSLDIITGLYASMVVVNILAALSGFCVTKASSAGPSAGFATTLGLVSALLALGVYWIYFDESARLPRAAAFFNFVCGILTAYSSTVMAAKSNDGDTERGNAHHINILQGNGPTVYPPPSYTVSQ